MRVAVDVTPLLGARTGVARTVEGLLGALPAAAPSVEVLPYVLSGRRAGRPRWAVAADTRVLPLPAAAAIRAWGRVGLPRADRWLGGVDVVHGTNAVVPPMRRSATTVTVHDCWCARHPERCRPEWAALAAGVQGAVDRGAFVHVGTEAVAVDVRAVYGAERVAVVPYGTPAVEAGKEIGDAGPFVLSVASAEPRKGLDALVRAYGLLAGDHPDLSLVLAGARGDASGAVASAIRSRVPPSARVRVLGTVDDATRWGLLRAARVLAYPSLDEGFGFPVLEAMAVGTPVVATAVGGVPEVAGDAAELVAPGDDAALAAALARVVDDEARRAELVAAGRARAALFTWERTAAGLAELWARAAAA